VIPPLLAALSDESSTLASEGECVAAVIEIIGSLIQPPGNPDAGGSNAAVLLGGDSKSLLSLLDLLERGDTYTCFETLGMLAALHRTAPAVMEATILEAPAGMGRLMSVLSDKREEVRNQGVLLWTELSSRNIDRLWLVGHHIR